jgi:hypothetical protein
MTCAVEWRMILRPSGSLDSDGLDPRGVGLLERRVDVEDLAVHPAADDGGVGGQGAGEDLAQCDFLRARALAHV